MLSTMETAELAATARMAGRPRAHVRTAAAAAARTHGSSNARRARASERPYEPILSRSADQQKHVNHIEKKKKRNDAGDFSKRPKIPSSDGRAHPDRLIPNDRALTDHDSLPVTDGPKLTHDSHTTVADAHPEPHEHTNDSSHAPHARPAGPARSKRRSHLVPKGHSLRVPSTDLHTLTAQREPAHRHTVSTEPEPDSRVPPAHLPSDRPALRHEPDAGRLTRPPLPAALTDQHLGKASTLSSRTEIEPVPPYTAHAHAHGSAHARTPSTTPSPARRSPPHLPPTSPPSHPLPPTRD
jgi:hypothetical protein